jgi:hypothetical protein
MVQKSIFPNLKPQTLAGYGNGYEQSTTIAAKYGPARQVREFSY